MRHPLLLAFEHEVSAPVYRHHDYSTSCFGQTRRLAKEYALLCETSQAMIYATMTRIMLTRLARA